ncbi:putative cell wall hydrolase [Halobacteroides halobius DSM 5150]|uniref:Putative cell wall hydrolase n=1 Tax=Halobacteroides halobius (strain ATCC 35273 / DSM 5150 / MD-1) TaxID=748449 RepID=L0K988_HALHC|nr:cell wall hydrolase [Halobacteroides halobius]AGB40683.1 putative cell wall hydrolase [Halobacteroides halobius DSM 5150]
MRKSLVMVLLCLMFVLLISQTGLATPRFAVKIIYTVQQGDALVELANQFGVSVRRIRRVNGLNKSEFIRYGQKLVIPQETSILSSEVSKNENLYYSFYRPQERLAKYKLDCNGKYEVTIVKETTPNIDTSDLRTLEYYIKRGDNLYELANEFNTSVAVVKKINNLDSNIIRLGKKIELPINNLTPKEVIYRTISDREFELLARLIHAESRGEPYIGQVAVGAVLLNRVISPSFPDNIRDVIYQPGQFSPVANGQINLEPNATSYRAARAALRGQDPTRGACYFYNPDTARYLWWFETREIVVEIGNHVFAK